MIRVKLKFLFDTYLQIISIYKHLFVVKKYLLSIAIYHQEKDLCMYKHAITVAPLASYT